MFTEYKEYIYGLLWMLVSPVTALIISLRQADRKLKRWMLVIFTTVFGSTFILRGDAGTHMAMVYNHYMGLSFAQFLSEAKGILLFHPPQGAPSDLYIHILSYFTGGVLGLPGLFFVFVAFVYGYFFAGSLFRLFEVFPSLKKDKLYFGLAIIFIIWLNIVGMETVRTWTGFWILFYACISYYKTYNKKYLLLMLIPPFIHFAYFIMAIPAWIVALVGNRKKVYTVLFIISFFSLLSTPQTIIPLLNKTKLGEQKVQSYRLESKITTQETLNRISSSRLYFKYKKIGIKYWAVVLIAFTLLVFGTYFRSFNVLESSLFSTGLLTKALANSTWYISALSNRLNIIASLFILAAVLLFIQRYYLSRNSLPVTKLQRTLLGIALVMLLPMIIVGTAQFTNYASAFLLIFPFVPWFTGGVNLSLAKVLPIREIIGFLI